MPTPIARGLRLTSVPLHAEAVRDVKPTVLMLFGGVAVRHGARVRRGCDAGVGSVALWLAPTAELWRTNVAGVLKGVGVLQRRSLEW